MSNRSTSAPIKAALYARISRDATGEEAGVTRQIQDCRALAKKLGYVVAGEFIDDDISASTKSRKKRPQYDDMMTRAKRGEFGAILAYSNSRLTRRVREYMDLIDLHNVHGVALRTVVSGEHNLATADGRGAALTVAVWDQAEAERTAERTHRAKQEMAKQGKFRGGQRPYGFERNGITVREREAEVIRYAAKAVLEGRTLAAIARDLNERGEQAIRLRPKKDADGRVMKTKSGKTKMDRVAVDWSYDRLKEMLVRPRNAGLLAHGVPGRKPDGRGRYYEFTEVGPAAWAAIIPEAEWRTLVAQLIDPSRRRQDGNDKRWLGSGIYVCGRCGHTMRPAPSRGIHLYRCVNAAHLTIAANRTDEFIRAQVAELLRDERIAKLLHPSDEGVSADRQLRSDLAARLRATERDYDNDLIDGVRYKAKRDKINAELAEVDSRLADALSRSASSSILDSVDPGQAFLDVAEPVPGKDRDGNPAMVPNPRIDVARAILSTVLSVVVQPQPQRGKQWTSDRLSLTVIEKPDPS